MALDLSVNTEQSCPLDLSTKNKDKANQMQSSSLKTKMASKPALNKVVTFAGNTSRVGRRNKQQTSWCLKKRILQCHREVLEKEKENHRESNYGCMAGDCKLERLEEGEAYPGQYAAHKDQSSMCLQGAVPEDCGADFTSFPLPLDPRDWSRLDVHIWLLHMKMTFDLNEVHPERFPMNGKGLCLMSIDMFTYREPDAGKILYRDFRLRLSRAMALQTRHCSL